MKPRWRRVLAKVMTSGSPTCLRPMPCWHGCSNGELRLAALCFAGSLEAPKKTISPAEGDWAQGIALTCPRLRIRAGTGTGYRHLVLEIA
jgi:hypothetical protein